MKGEQKTMKHFKNIDDLHAFLERQAKRTIKYYYTDWKNYDRPALMKYTGSREKEIYIIFREAGSYIYTAADILDYDFAATVMDYYISDKTAKYYKVNLDALTAELIPAGMPSHIKAERSRREHELLLAA